MTVFPVGTCQSRVNGMSASSPARIRTASEYEEPGSRVIAITRRMTSGYDISRRRSRGRSRPSRTAFPAIVSITPSPRCASSPPRRTRFGSHASASTVPSRFTNAGAVTTGRKNTVFSPFNGAAPATVTVRPLRTCRSATRTASVPAGVVPAAGNSPERIAASVGQGKIAPRDSSVSVDSTLNAYQESLLSSKLT